MPSFLRREGLARGIPRGRLDRDSYLRPFYGLRVLRGEPVAEESLLQQCRWYAPRLRPGQYFSHGTALALRGVPVPKDSAGEIHISAHRPAQAPRLAGIVGHRLQPRDEDVGLCADLPTLMAAAAWAQVLPLWRHDDLVIAADRLVTPRQRIATIEELKEAAVRARRTSAAMRVLQDVREGSESPRETQLRLSMLRAGLPEPVLGLELRDASGRFLARLDMAYPEYRVAIEYDGRQHAQDVAQFERDADRWHDIREEGWELVRVLSHHVIRDGGRPSVERIKTVLRRRGWPG